ncbi:mrna decapping hydrolase like [Lecanosticta acicola]|uniref:Mrna decapping hydrolase like n=1 Tax=Lecanosticta acicola TaxID=111012 RepID=A0AAI8Z8T9_9PEZI|nr:mrna decapping hydrolase like [Lecanosticta acicola]
MPDTTNPESSENMHSPEESNTLLTRFKFTNLLNTDQQGRRLILQGTIASQPALLLAERAAFSTEPQYLTTFNRLLLHIQTLGTNDVYKWYLANSLPENGLDQACPADLKINLIWPAGEKHLRKYKFQQMRVVRETAGIYQDFVRPYMRSCREGGRLNWVFNILDGIAEQENVLFRSAEWGKGLDRGEGFLLLPDLNWDRKTRDAMHLLALVERRDLWSVRDLKRRDLPFLRLLHRTLLATITKELYPEVEADMLKFYIHYQPTYYHFHVHIVHVNLDATGTQAVGKALGLETVVSMLENLQGGEDEGMEKVELCYTVGEESELWQKIFLPLKEGREPSVDKGTD